MENKIHLVEKMVWGTKRFYPNCKISEMICGLIKKPTFPLGMIKEIKTYGWKVFVACEGKNELER